MDAIRTTLRQLRSDKCGATAVEYALIAALIVIALAGGLSALGGGSNGIWTMIATRVTEAS